MNMSQKPRYAFDEVRSIQRAALVTYFGKLLSYYHTMPKRTRNSVLINNFQVFAANNLKMYAYWMSFKKFAQHYRSSTNQENSNFEVIRYVLTNYKNIQSDLPHNTTGTEPIAFLLESLHEQISILEARMPTI